MDDISNTYVSGINEQKLLRLSFDLKEYAEKISNKFDEITLLINKTDSCFDSVTGNTLRKKYNELQDNYIIVKQNILKYAEDLELVKKNYNVFENEVSNNFGKDKIFEEIRKD